MSKVTLGVTTVTFVISKKTKQNKSQGKSLSFLLLIFLCRCCFTPSIIVTPAQVYFCEMWTSCSFTATSVLWR